MLAMLVLAACTSGSTHDSSSRSVPQAEGALGGGSNVAVTADRVVGHVEPDVAVNPADANNLLGACQYETGPRTRLPGTFVSFDGGRSWHDNGILPLPPGYEGGADTTVAFGQHGTGFVVALLYHGGGGYPSRVERGGIFIWRTRDGGRTYVPPEAVYVGDGFQDHPWLGIRQIGGTAEMFIAWTNNAGLEFTTSTDDGATFAKPRLLVGGSTPANPVLTVGAAGLIEVFFEEFIGPDVRLSVVTSTDDGGRFAPPQVVGSVVNPPASGGGPKGNGTQHRLCSRRHQKRPAQPAWSPSRDKTLPPVTLSFNCGVATTQKALGAALSARSPEPTRR